MFENPEDILGKQAHIWHGVAIGWRRDINASVKILDSTCDRIAAIKIEFNERSLLLLSIYAPTSGQDDEFLELISHLSDIIRKHSSPSDQVLIGGDSNCSTKSSKRRQLAWEGFCSNNMVKTYLSSQPSFHHHNGLSESFIDIFAASTSLELGLILQNCTLDSPHNLSSHDPIFTSVKVELQEQRNKEKYTKTYTKFNRQKIAWDSSKIPEYQQLAFSALSEAVSYWNTPECIPVLSSLISKLLVTCGTQVFPTKSSCTKKSAKKPPLKIRQARNTLARTFNAWKNAGKPRQRDDPLGSAYREARTTLQRISRHYSTLTSIKQNNLLMQLNRRNKSQIFAEMKKARGDFSEHATNILHTPVGTFYDEDVLEGFAADAEYLGKSNEGASYCDQGFYNLCKLDNAYIFDFSFDEQVSIPPMTISQLNSILSTKMQTGKACDVYQLTVEHLRYCGHEAKLLILSFINRILSNIYYLSCPQLKTGLGTAVFKGKKKPLSKSSSYRRITVTPILGALIDYHLDPIAEAIFRPHQSPDQLGFTTGISYLLAAIQRGECQRWAIDNKLTCFGVSLDGEAAFPSVEREIQVRELYSVGERGDVLQYSRNTYRNTECRMKMQDKLSRKVVEHKGNRQGHIRASGHFKVYINPCLLSLNTTKLGFSLGPMCITAVCIADDTYVVSGSPSGLQGALDLISHYARRYQLRFNAEKTKIVVTGSKQDMSFYKDTTPWTLNGEVVRVVDINEHLGLQVSGGDEEQLNIDENIVRCRNSLFALLGPAYSYRCLLSPTVQIHLWRTCNLPVLLSGLSALPVRPAKCKSLEIFQKKTLRGFLKLSKSSPTPALFFLLGELPIEGLLHIRTLGLFHNILSNPRCTVFKMIGYILMMSGGNSTTWANHVQLLCLKYGLPSPLSLLLRSELSPCIGKEEWNILVKTRVTAWYERELRNQAHCNSKMRYLNVSLTGLSGQPHIVLHGILSTQDAKKLRLHLKFLTCDFFCNELLSHSQPSISPACDFCPSPAPVDSIEHALVSCLPMTEIKSRLYAELVNTIAQVQPNCSILREIPTAPVLAQFILDCTSPNLPQSIRIPAHNPGIVKICKISRDWCFAISCERLRLSKQLKQMKAKTTNNVVMT